MKRRCRLPSWSASRYASASTWHDADDAYNGLALGPRDGSSNNAAIDASYALTRDWTLSAFVSRNEIYRDQAQFVFTGDAPNDSPMFGFFDHAVGVANVMDFRDRLAAEPAYITLARGGAGFAEVAAALLDSRAAPGIR